MLHELNKTERNRLREKYESEGNPLFLACDAVFTPRTAHLNGVIIETEEVFCAVAALLDILFQAGHVTQQFVDGLWTQLFRDIRQLKPDASEHDKIQVTHTIFSIVKKLLCHHWKSRYCDTIFDLFTQTIEKECRDADKEEIELLKRDGASDIDIELTNAGMQHKEEKVIELLQKGASPYFLNLTEYIGKPNREIHYGYFEVAMLLSQLDSEWCDQWDIHGLTLLRKDISLLDDEDLELIVFDLFNAAASQRILYLVDKYISDEARAKGEELMRKYDAYYPILRRKPEEI